MTRSLDYRPAVLHDVSFHADPHKLLLRRGDERRELKREERITSLKGVDSVGINELVKTDIDNQQLARQNGYDEGYAMGFEQGKEKGYGEGLNIGTADARKTADMEISNAIENGIVAIRESLQIKADRFEKIILSLQEQVAQKFTALEDDMVALTFEATCKIIGQHLVTIEGIRSCLKQALVSWHGQKPITVNLNPDDVQFLQEQGALDSQKLNGYEVTPDPMVQLGGCILRGSEGSLDARLESQLHLLIELLAHTRTQRSSTLQTDLKKITSERVSE